MRRLNDALERLTEILLTAFMGGLIFSTAAQVFGRFVLKSPLMWTEEGSRYCFLWIAMLGAALGVKDRAHFVIDFLVSALPGRVRAAASTFGHLVMWLVALVLLVAGTQYVFRTWNVRSATLGISMATVYVSAPLSGLMMICYLLEQLPEVIGRWRGSPAAAESREVSL